MPNRILIIGDSCKDVFVRCEANRLCPDVPVPVLNIVSSSENPGMALNVQSNILALGCSCDIVTNSNWQEMTKIRYVHATSNHAFFRVDSSVPAEKYITVPTITDYDMIVIVDYNKGFLSEEDISLVCSMHNNVFVDTKKRLGAWIKNAKYIKINNNEYEASLPWIDAMLKERIVRTMGGQGCEHKGVFYPVQHEAYVRDVSGAGDTFLAGLCVSYLQNNDIETAIRFANKCASSVVRHRGVTVVDPREIG